MDASVIFAGQGVELKTCKAGYSPAERTLYFTRTTARSRQTKPVVCFLLTVRILSTANHNKVWYTFAILMDPDY